MIKENVKKEKAITLIALIITLIVLLILTGITIATLTGENGILTKASKGAEETKIKTAEEKLKLAVSEYQLEMKKVSMYSILNKVEGMESINPEDEQHGLPYQVIVDGYEFLITDETGKTEIIYLGEVKGVAPEIIKIEKEIIDQTNAKIKIQAKTEDKEGLEKIILMKKSNKLDEKDANGKNITEEFNVSGNGIYTIIVIGKNKRRTVSQEIEIAKLLGVRANIQAGTVIDGNVLLTVTANSDKTDINKIEIYAGQAKVKEIPYSEPKIEVESEYETGYMPFFEEKTYFAKIITNTQTNTEQVKVKNSDTIKTQDDLRKLATVVNEGQEQTGFEGKTIKQIDSITLTSNYYTAIGTQVKPFKGIYDGKENTINNLNINTTNDFQGMFGYVENATLKNLTLQSGSITGGNRVGGLAGYAKEANIQNIQNNQVNVTSTTSYGENVQLVDTIENTTIINAEYIISPAGGICGMAENSNIENCNNINAQVANLAGRFIGGIVGYAKSDKTSKIINCVNRGEISSYEFAGGIAGSAYGYIEIEKSTNRGSVSTKDIGGGILGNIVGGSVKECSNEKNVIGKFYIGGICGAVHDFSVSTYALVENCKNLATITSNGAGGTEGTRDYYQQGIVNNYTISSTGGIVGYGNRARINQCYNEGKIIFQNPIASCTSTGGICGEIRDGKVENCYNKGVIEYNAQFAGIGGIVGLSYYNSYINNCYNVADINGREQVGGIVGQGSQTNIRHCYNKGTVNGNNHIGGIAGYLMDFRAGELTNNYLENCYNIGNIIGTQYIGTMTGYISCYNIDYVYWLANSYGPWGTLGNWGGKANQASFNTEKEVIDKLLSDTNNNFKKGSDGYPILNWQ